MRSIINFFKQRWVLTLLGVIAISLLIWYVTPLIAFGRQPYYPFADAWMRAGLIALVIVVWMARVLWRWLKTLRANAQMLGQLVAKPAAQPSASQRAGKEEVDELRQRTEEAIQFLKKARIGGGALFGKQYVYQLPWYVIIGAPGSGKTTALINSGIKFPLADRLGAGAVKGMGGTRNCDWWFTDDAVLLDTAGRYATQDSHQEVDAAAWKGFLDLLKKHRPRRPLNGVLVTVSVSDLLRLSSVERQAHATQLKQRIQELHKHFGIRFPVYVLFTKIDLIPGFVEFFAPYGREEREQVWGMTFPLDDASTAPDVMQAYAANFSALERRLNDRLVERLQHERDAQRRALLYGFPQQFGALKDLTERFLNEIFQPNKFEERVLMRGVYFTSGTQEGTPIDRLMGTLASTFGVEGGALSTAPGSGKGYFIHRLLREVVFAEQGLAGTNLKLERKRQWLQGAAYALAGVLTLCAVLAWLTSYQRNSAYTKTVDARANEIRAELKATNVEAANLVGVLALLDALRGVPGGYADRDKGTPLMMGLGLYQGDKLGSEAYGAYQRSLERMLLPKLKQRLERQLRSDGDNLDFLFEALRVYLMLGDPQRFNAEAIVAWLDLDWEQSTHEINADQRQRLLQHAAALFEPGVPPAGSALDKMLVEQTRHTLMQMPLPQRVYNQLKRQPDVAQLPKFSAAEVAGREGPLVFVRKSGSPLGKPMAGVFTIEGYHEVFAKTIDAAAAEAAKDTWVLGDLAPVEAKDHAKLSDEVRRLYFEEYIQQWERLLGDLTVTPFTDINRAMLVLNYLSNPTDSPLRKLLLEVKRQTSLYREPEGALDKLMSKGMNQTLREKIPGLGTKPSSAAATFDERVVDRHFGALHKFVEGGGKEGVAPLDKTLGLLNELNAYLGAIASALQSGQRPPLPTPQNAQTLQQLRIEAPRNPVPVGGMMSRVAEGTNSIIFSGADSLLNSAWKSAVLPLCRQGIQSRYPISRRAGQEVTREDFGQFFGPGGLMDQFFQQHLKDSVDTNRTPWAARSYDGSRFRVSGSGLVSFQNAARIREVLFRGSQTPTVSFELKPLEMDQNLQEFILDVDGQVLKYDHGPLMATPFRWPGPKGTGQVRIEYSPPSSSGRAGVSEDGPWALFRMFDRARMETTNQQNRFIVTFDLEGRLVSFELRASSVLNPFRLAALESFQCPDNL